MIKPLASDEDDSRREFILNTLLTASIFLLLIMDLFILNSSIVKGAGYRGTPFWFFTGILTIFILLLALSRYGEARAASYVLVGMYYLCVTYAAHSWGIHLPAALLGYVLVITIASILISTKGGICMTIIVSMTLLGLGLAHIYEIHTPRIYWRDEPLATKEIIQFICIYSFIMTISWLSNREIERSLKRAHASEKLLREERDSLEMTVIQRTKELRMNEIEKIGQLYRFAEFGKLSSGVFHDLINPLSALILSVEQLSLTSKKDTAVQAQKSIDTAINASRRMESFIGVIRKQIEHTEDKQETFSAKAEIDDAIDIMGYKALTKNVTISFKALNSCMLTGSKIKFHQIMTNLISNAIDAYDATSGNEKIVHVTLSKAADHILISIQDYGTGILEHNLEHIFEPFFTTKGSGKGLGIGLSTTKQFVEKNFMGTIHVSGTEHSGTTFEIHIPCTENQ